MQPSKLVIAVAVVALTAEVGFGQTLTLEDFETNLNAYTTLSGQPKAVLDPGAAHDGAKGGSFETLNMSWYYRTDVVTAPGDRLRAFVRCTNVNSSFSGVYLGFSAGPFGCWSGHWSPATDTLTLQNNFQYGYTGMAVTTFAGQSGTWYVLEVDWAVNGDISVNMYDESATTLLATTGVFAAGLTTPGGFAMRAFTADTFAEFHMDTVRRLPAPPEVYCTAGTSASGCQALIGATGIPSASAGSGFTLTLSGVEGQKDGLFFFGTGGRQANPWGNGTSYQCVAPPVTRTPLLIGAGTQGACDGTHARDLNAAWCTGCPFPGKNPGAGAVVQAQGWYRDPFSTSNQTTSLSDAIEFTVLP